MTTTRSPQIDLGERTVGEVMRLGVVTCAPDTALSEVARLMSAYRIHCVVVDGLGEEVHGTRLVWGVVSDLDLARAVASGQEATAGQVAATEPMTASPYDTLTDVAQVMSEHEVAHLVVIDGAGRGAHGHDLHARPRARLLRRRLGAGGRTPPHRQPRPHRGPGRTGIDVELAVGELDAFPHPGEPEAAAVGGLGVEAAPVVGHGDLDAAVVLRHVDPDAARARRAARRW